MRIAPSLAGPALAGLALAAAPAPARAEAAPPPIATCGSSQLELAPGKGGAAELRAQIATPKGTWQFAANVGLVRVGRRTRTIAAEEPRPEGGGKPPYATQPSQVTIDLFVDGKRLTARHASEGGSDPAIAIDLAGCKFAADLDARLAALAEPPPEPAGCDPATVRKVYAPRLAPLKLPAADADKEARGLCEDHQPTIAARARLEQRLADRAADQRAAARGRALLAVEEARIKALAGVDACIAKAEPAEPLTAQKLRAAEPKLRACYDRAAPDKK